MTVWHNCSILGALSPLNPPFLIVAKCREVPDQHYCHNVTRTKLLQSCPSDGNGCNMKLRQHHELHISKVEKHKNGLAPSTWFLLVQCLVGDPPAFLHTLDFHPTQLGYTQPNIVWPPPTLDNLPAITNQSQNSLHYHQRRKLPRLGCLCILGKFPSRG